MDLQKIIVKTLIAVSLFASNMQTAFSQKETNPKTVLIIVDGIPADLLEKVATPNIDAISQEGAYSRAYLGGERGGYSETPTISAVGYNSMLTGTWANKHNVWGNGIEEPNYNYWTLFRLLKENKPASKLGIYSTWLDNRTKLLGDGLPQTNELKLDYHFDGYELDTVRFPHDTNSKYINLIDEEVTLQASNSIRKDAPDLSWVYLQYTDDIGHRYGDSEIMIDAIKKVDRQIGEIYNAVKYREQYFDEDWMVVITTDHGRDVASGLSHGAQSDRERTTWIVTNKSKLNQHFYAHTPAIVDILPSVANHMKIVLNKSQEYELDGVPFLGDVSIADPLAVIKGNELQVEWTAFAKDGKVKLLVSATNNFNKGGLNTLDQYELLGEYNISDRKAVIQLPQHLLKSKFLKVVIEGKYNSLNRWIIKK